VRSRTPQRSTQRRIRGTPAWLEALRVSIPRPGAASEASSSDKRPAIGSGTSLRQSMRSRSLLAPGQFRAGTPARAGRGSLSARRANSRRGHKCVSRQVPEPWHSPHHLRQGPHLRPAAECVCWSARIVGSKSTAKMRPSAH
jgi:hypothetical protein